MLAWLHRSRRKRQLSPVITMMPWVLTKSYGSGSTYSVGQIMRAAEKLKLRPKLLPFSLAAYCQPSELTIANCFSKADISRLRSELIDLFELSYVNFNVEDVRRLRIRPQWHSAEWWHSDWSEYRDGGHSSHDVH
jgi:hypothetical protein